MQWAERLHHRLLILLALGVAAALGLFASYASAQSRATHYTDVQAGAWYEDAASALLESGALDESEPRLRPNELATRAEVMKLLVQAFRQPIVSPTTASFNDVQPWAWYYPFVETAADARWVKGDGDCYKVSRPCTARPGDNVNRAEMAALLQRAYALSRTGDAPIFSDNRSNAWYFTPVQVAADHCILQGDEGSTNVRPAALMNRAEMIVMVDRASNNLTYGEDCGPDSNEMAEISGVSVVSNTRIRVNFSTALTRNSSDDESQYMVEESDGSGDIDVESVTFIDNDTVELELESSLEEDTRYSVMVHDLMADGRMFSDSASFTSLNEDEDAEISGVTVRESAVIRVAFSMDLDESRAEDEARYEIERASGGGIIDIERATLVDDRTVELELENDLVSQTTYILSVENLRTEDGEEFTDSQSFARTEASATLTDLFAQSATRVRLLFNVDLDEDRVEDDFRYTVRANNQNIGITDATFIDDRTVELTLNQSLQAQRQYTVTATDLRTAGGATFTQTGSFLYNVPVSVMFTANLTGLQEVPSVATTATGTGSFTLTSTGLQYSVTLRNLSGSVITMAHFHKGATGVSGPVVEPITFTSTGTGSNTVVRASGTWTGLTAEERDDLLNNNIYVNVHTQANPNGEIRGQLIRQ